MAILEIENLSLSFGGIRALQSVSLSVEPGELYAVIGAQRGGKNIAAQLHQRVLQARSGQYRI
jgi:ABC-type branched-subunit amino acid transport system ATPase component